MTQLPASLLPPPSLQVGEEGFYPAGLPQVGGAGQSCAAHVLWCCTWSARAHSTVMHSICGTPCVMPTPWLPRSQTAANPQGAQSWANTEGQNFVADHASPDIDFMSIHLWINNWWVRG